MRVVLAILSALTLLVTGYGWSIYRQIEGGLATSDVLNASHALDGAVDILLVGLDSRTDAQGNPLPQQVLDQLNAGPDTGELNTDTLILVRIPNDPKLPATAVSIPRDSYVSIPGYGTHKINSAYARGRATALSTLQAKGVTGADLERQADDAGRRTLIATIQALTGSSIDHYAEVNLAGFAEITQTVGGVPVCLNAPVHDSYSGANFPAGPQTVEGVSALQFVRQRHGLPRGDLDREVRQQAFLAGLAHTMLSAGTLANPATLSRLIQVVSHYVVVDPGWDLMQFATTEAQGLTGGNITFRTMPVGRIDLPTPSDGVAVQVDPAVVKSFFTDLVNPPSATPAPGATAPAANPVVVDVTNATSRSGLAAAVSDTLDNSGFAPGRVGTGQPAGKSTVRAAAGTQDAANQVAQLLGGLTVRTDSSVPSGRVEVTLGRDYSGPATSSGSGQSASASTAAPASGDDATGAAPASPTITAGGTPCVN